MNKQRSAPPPPFPGLQKLLAFEKFLEEHPEWRDKVGPSASGGRPWPPAGWSFSAAFYGASYPADWPSQGLPRAQAAARPGSAPRPAPPHMPLAALPVHGRRILPRSRPRARLPSAPCPAPSACSAGAAGADCCALAHRRARVPTAAQVGAGEQLWTGRLALGSREAPRSRGRVLHVSSRSPCRRSPTAAACAAQAWMNPPGLPAPPRLVLPCSMVHEIVGRINGQYGTLTHVPIYHLDR